MAENFQTANDCGVGLTPLLGDDDKLPADTAFIQSLGFVNGRYIQGQFGDLMFQEYSRDGVLRLHVSGHKRITGMSRGEVLALIRGLGVAVPS